MPNRIIKESICTSDNIDRLTPFEETVFVRLMVNCDDFGRFDGRAKILSARLFPLKQIAPEEMEEAIASLVAADLVTVYVVEGKPFVYMNSWEKHQSTRASKSKYPSPDEGTRNELQASESTCKQMQSSESNCSRIRIRNRNTLFDNRNRNTEADEDADNGFMDDDEARKIQDEHNRVFDAAEDAGFKISNSVRAKLLKLYADYGFEKMLAGFDSCVKHGACNLAYLEACMKGGGQKKPTVKALPAQDFTQRDYSGVPDELTKGLADEIARFNAEQNAQ